MSRIRAWGMAACVTIAGVWTVSCGAGAKPNPADEAPPDAKISVENPDLNVIKVDRPERFRLVTAGQREDVRQLHVTGVINPDIDRSIPVISLASGRAVALYTKLGDDVKKGQLLLQVLSNDISTGFSTYEQAKADEVLAAKQLDRARLLYEHGAIARNDLEVAEDAEQKAKVALDTAAEQLRALGGDVNHPSPVVNVYAPATGTIVEQNIVPNASVHTPDNQPNLFTIADLSWIWVLCDVYENDLPIVRVGDKADIQLNAYPGQTFTGRVSNIGKVLDPNLRTAKVRIEIRNPGMMRAGMFATATFYGLHGREYATVPSTALLRLHDRTWLFVPAGNGTFRRTEVTGTQTVGNLQQVASGIKPGDQVVNDALALQAESQQ
jgi:cobalt-zinc-cadmium efflux system membrane fusion protein